MRAPLAGVAFSGLQGGISKARCAGTALDSFCAFFCLHLAESGHVVSEKMSSLPKFALRSLDSLHPPLSVQRQQDSEHRGANSEEDDRCRFESGKVQRAVFGTLGREDDGSIDLAHEDLHGIAFLQVINGLRSGADKASLG